LLQSGMGLPHLPLRAPVLIGRPTLSKREAGKNL